MRCITALTTHELKRYDRQIRLPEIGKKGQEKLKAASVVVIGAGALGCPVLQYLTAAGVGTIGIVDNDWVDESNLQRQILYGSKDIEKPKPVAARDSLSRNNPEIKFNIHYIRFDIQSALKILVNYDIIVDCTDNFSTRYLISDAAVMLNKPVVYGALYKFSGQAVVLNYKNGPTLRCIFPEPPHPLEVPDCNEVGVLGSVAGIIGSVQATEVIKIILETDGVLSGKMFIIDAMNFSTQLVSFERIPERCEIRELKEYDFYCSPSDQPVTEIDLSKLKKMIDEDPAINVIDLREEELVTDLGIKTTHIPYRLINRNIDNILKMNTTVFLCNNGIQSTDVVNYFLKTHNKNKMYVLNL
jgi:adenylyltransferase/sulfurtransferase